jgi:hypothetical protein
MGGRCDVSRITFLSAVGSAAGSWHGQLSNCAVAVSRNMGVGRLCGVRARVALTSADNMLVAGLRFMDCLAYGNVLLLCSLIYFRGLLDANGRVARC